MYNQFFLLFSIVFTGFLLRKVSFINAEMNSGLNKFIMYFAYPCLLVYCIGTLELTFELLKNFIIVLFLSTALLFIYGQCMKRYATITKKKVNESNVFELTVISTNNGFMGFPIALSFFGELGLLFMVANNAALSLFVFSYGLVALRRNNEHNTRFTFAGFVLMIGKLLLNPNILGVAVGIAVCLLRIPIDNIVGEYMQMIGSIATPMAMVFIGSTLAEHSFKEVFKHKIVWEASIIKLFIVPILTIIAVYFMPADTLVKSITVLSFVLPTGTVVPMLAEQEQQNKDLGSRIMFLTTVFSMGTILLFVEIIKYLF
ncbi:MAG: AEC family transporter [Lentihominibacter sp.]|jgi:predicted permease